MSRIITIVSPLAEERCLKKLREAEEKRRLIPSGQTAGTISFVEDKKGIAFKREIAWNEGNIFQPIFYAKIYPHSDGCLIGGSFKLSVPTRLFLKGWFGVTGLLELFALYEIFRHLFLHKPYGMAPTLLFLLGPALLFLGVFAAMRSGQNSYQDDKSILMNYLQDIAEGSIIGNGSGL